MTVTATRSGVRKTPDKVDITKLNNRELEALDEDVFIASLSPWLRKLMTAAKPFKGKLR
jgi:hypothetical protein